MFINLFFCYMYMCITCLRAANFVLHVTGHGRMAMCEAELATSLDEHV